MPFFFIFLSLGAVYMCTEDTFPHKRLKQLAEGFARQHHKTPQELSDNIFVEHSATIVSNKT